MNRSRGLLLATALVLADDFAYARYYDAGTGRFLEEDPAGMGSPLALYAPQRLNPYAYVANNPINLLDPWGLDYLLFKRNKNELTWVFETAGRESGRASWPASSGIPGIAGSIPLGTYYTSPLDREVRFPTQAWGPLGYRLHESLTTRILNRLTGHTGGFFIHGGYGRGTLGCIEFQDYAPEQISLFEFDALMKTYGKTIRLNVDK
jgi:RHS repeat-associated protein